MLRLTRIAVVILSVLLTCGNALAAEGVPDPTFGTGGYATTPLRGSGYPWVTTTMINDIALQADGKFVVAGAAGMDLALARYNANGSLDATFGNGGSVVVDLSLGVSDRANAIAVQRDGKIVIAGHDTNDYLVARFTASGALDPSFGNGGVVKTDFHGGWRDFGQDMLIQPDGKIVVVGGSLSYPIDHISLARYNTDGSLDTTFGSGGLSWNDFRNHCGYKHSFGSAVALLPDGKLVIAGFLGAPCDLNGVFAIFRYSANGSLETFEELDEFADDVATTKVGGAVMNRAGLDDRGYGVGVSSAAAIVVQPDGKIIAAGTAAIPGTFDTTIALVRHNPDGTRDNSFGKLGRVNVPIPTSAEGYDMALQADGKIVVAGDWWNATGAPSMMIARYDPAGQLDAQFGTGGIAKASFGGTSVGNAMVIQSDGAIVVAGSAETNENSFALARFTGARPPSSLSVTAIAQKIAGADGYLTTTIYGVGIQPGASVALHSGAHNVAGTNVTVLAKGMGITASFDLRGLPAGAYDIEIVNPDGTRATLGSALTVIANGTRKPWAGVTAPRQARPGAKFRATVSYGNAGTTDAIIFLMISVDEDAFTQWGFNPYHGPLSPEDDGIDYGQLPKTIRRFNSETGKYEISMPLAIYAPAGFSGSVNVPMVMPLNCKPVNIRASVNDCLINAADLLSSFLPGSNCVKGMFEFLGFMGLRDKFGTPVTLSAATADLIRTVAKCALEFVPGAKIVLVISDLYEKYEKGDAAVSSCGNLYFNVQTNCANSFDPNDKIGPAGVGASRYVNADHPLSYSIFFENKATASAAAQVVKITDRLDTGRFDLDTFTLGPISWGDRQITPPQGLSSYETDVDLRPAVNVMVRIEAKLDKSTGVVQWTFTSLDPSTGELTTDPIAGFLPPNRTAPEGEAAVSFNVRLQAGVADGALVQNMARIVFDINAPIDTPVWSNAVDKTAPSSAVTAGGAQQCNAFTVSWSGSDAASGVRQYDIHVSKNGEPYEQWLRGVALTSAVFSGQQGRSYAFYSVARDFVGHAEEPPASPDVVVSVKDTVAPAIIAPASQRVSTGPSTTSCGVMIPDAVLGTATATDNCSTATVKRSGVPANNIFPVGTTTITYTAEDAAGNGASATQTVTVIDNTPPAILSARSDKTELWPVTHKMVDVTISADVVDACGSSTWSVAKVASNEPQNGTGDGQTVSDWEIVDTTHVRLRAERAGTGNGRIYTIVVEAVDAYGNRAARDVVVRVPIAASK